MICPTSPSAKTDLRSHSQPRLTQLNPRHALSLRYLPEKDYSRCQSEPQQRSIHDVPNERVANLCIRATELTVQSERAFQKQPHIFQNSKARTKSTRPGKGGRRWYKDVGLGFRTPKAAIEGTYIGTWDVENIWSGEAFRRRSASKRTFENADAFERALRNLGDQTTSC